MAREDCSYFQGAVLLIPVQVKAIIAATGGGKVNEDGSESLARAVMVRELLCHHDRLLSHACGIGLAFVGSKDLVRFVICRHTVDVTPVG